MGSHEVVSSDLDYRGKSCYCMSGDGELIIERGSAARARACSAAGRFDRILTFRSVGRSVGRAGDISGGGGGGGVVLFPGLLCFLFRPFSHPLSEGLGIHRPSGLNCKLAPANVPLKRTSKNIVDS